VASSKSASSFPQGRRRAACASTTWRASSKLRISDGSGWAAMQTMIRQDWPADLSISGYRNPRRSSMANQSAIKKRLEFFSRTRRKFKSLSFSARKRTSKYTCPAGLNRLRENSQKQIPRGKKTPLDCTTTLLVATSRLVATNRARL